MEPWIGPRVGIVIDCNNIEVMSNFWCAALRYQLRGDVGHYRSLVAPGNDEPRIIMQLVSEPRTSKNRLHIDFHADDIEAEATRIVGLGARRIDVTPNNEVGSRWIRMLDPEGNEFCIVEARG
jgi:predicted enzyme related to lactoylglutathione lyase